VVTVLVGYDLLSCYLSVLLLCVSIKLITKVLQDRMTRQHISDNGRHKTTQLSTHV